MADEQLSPEEEIIDLDQDGPVPVPVPPPHPHGESDAEGPQPVPVPAKKEEEVLEPIKLVDGVDEDAPTQRKAFGSAAARAGFDQRSDWKRSLNYDGTGATRVKIFHSKIADGPLEHMEQMVNEWIDDNPGIEVKFVTQSIGVWEGKRAEQNILMMVWY